MYYKVTSVLKGKRTETVIEAEHPREAAARARKENPGASIVGTKEVSAPLEDTFAKILKDFSKRSQGKIPPEAKISTIRQIAVMTDAGIAIHDTLDEVGKHVENKRLKEIYLNISGDINAGKSMSDAMEPYGEEFGNVALAMTKLGESTGNFPEAYHKLANIMEEIRDNIKKFKKGIKSPLITLGAMGVAFTILITVVVPKFREIFEQLNTELPVPTKILLALEYGFSHYGLYILAIMFGSIYMFIFSYKNNKKFKYKMDKVMLSPKFYLINKIIFLSTMHRYTLVFGELVKAGTPVSEALTTSVEMVDNLYIKEQLLTVNANIGRGMSLAESFEQTGLFENMLLQMIKAGEAGGQLDKMLDKVTGYYAMSFQEIIDNLSTYIEPILMFFISGLVLLMALGIFMPMWGMGEAAKNG